MLRSTGVLLVLLLAAAATAQQPDCDLGQPEALNDCLKQLLEGLRGDVHRRSDPLVLPGSSKQKGRVTTTVSDITIHGLAAYDIRHLNVAFPEGATQLRVQATIGWPRIRGNVHARAKAEKKIWRKKIRASASGSAEVRVKNPVGSLDVTIQIDVSENGTITARPVSTAVSVTLSDIDVDITLGSRNRWVYRLIGDPISNILEVVAEHMWKRRWRRDVERKAKEALEKAIVEKLGVQLSELLHN